MALNFIAELILTSAMKNTKRAQPIVKMSSAKWAA